jgi:hypothetical protein
MALFKKHLLFFISVLVLLGIGATAVFLVLGDQAKAKERQNQFQNANQQLASVINRSPAPTRENLELAEAQVAELENALAQAREVLRGPGNIAVNNQIDSVRFISSLQAYLSNFRRLTQDNNIRTPDNFGFGFARYASAADQPPADRVPALDLQRQILTFLLNRLIEAQPQEIVSIQREAVEDTVATTNQAGAGAARGQQTTTTADSFVIDPFISARVPGAIDTLAFRLTFVGYTSSLRHFLNELALYEQPVVVRNVEVRREDATTRAGSATPAATASAGDAFARLFGAPEPAAAATPAVVTQLPVVDENTSRFTVTVEFIRLVESPPAAPVANNAR